MCEGSVVAEDGTTRVQHCVEGCQCVGDNLESGRRWGEWERGWGEEQREEKVKLWWRYIEEADGYLGIHMARNYIPNMSN